MKILIILILSTLSFSSFGFPIPKDNKATFDMIRKNKVIGNVETIFTKTDEILTIKTDVNVSIKFLFIQAYKFSQTSIETWSGDEFLEFDGHTDFEDEREYFIKGKDIKNNFIATGMDGKLILDKNILPMNYWNKEILNKKKVFDTQKGIVREINVEKDSDEIIKINDREFKAEKYILNGSTNPKDKGPFPQYTLWYAKNGELLKFQFKHWKDKKLITTQ
ncbi:uncharacterized protein METZ01_LOCUS298498, partial [marine metagenome]